MKAKSMFAGTVAGILISVFGAGIAAFAKLPPQTPQIIEVTSAFIDAGSDNYLVLTKDPETSKISQMKLKDAAVYADVPNGVAMYVKLGVRLTEIHVHGAQNIAGGSWQTHDFLNMHTDDHRLVKLD